MKTFAICLLLSLVTIASNAQAPSSDMDTFDGCGLSGNAKSANLTKLNQLKNRYTLPSARKINHSITLSALLEPGDDRSKWSSGSSAEVVGYVLDVKPGGPETCNCGKKDPKHSDTHIELVQHATDTAVSQSVVVEVTPRLRAIMQSKGVDWSTSALRKKYLHKWVRVRGWMLFDSQHTGSAENTNPHGTHNWRATAWEIHPITRIQLAPAP